MTAEQIKLCRTLLNKAGLTPYKEDIVSSHTNDRTVSLTDCNNTETQAIVKYLKGYIGQPESSEERMRRKLISMAHEMFWKLPNGRVNMDQLNGWLYHYGKYHKKLNDLNADELPGTLTQFEKVLNSFLIGI